MTAEKRRGGGLAILVPQLPPAMCGVGDYTARLLELLGHQRVVSIAVLRGTEASRKQFPDLPIVELEPQARALRKWLLRVQPEMLFIQYSAYGLHSHGCPIWLVRGLDHISYKLRIAVMFHELWSEHQLLTPAWLLQVIHRFLIRKLVKLSTIVFTNTRGYQNELTRLAKTCQPVFLPIPSTIPVISGGKKREAGLAVLFGRQGTRLEALQGFREGLRSLVQSGRITNLVTIGGDSSEEANVKEERELRMICQAAAWKRRGRVSAEEISCWLQRTEFAISTQDFLSFSKSTTFMAYASHGAAILSPFARQSAEAPFCWLTGADELQADLPNMQELLRQRRTSLREWYEMNSDWSIIVERVRLNLRTNSNDIPCLTMESET